MNEFLDILFYFFVAYLIARFLLWLAYNYLHKQNEELKQQLVDVVKKFIFVIPEKHGDTIYLFDANTGQFVAQGKTVDELKSHCQLRFPDKNVVVSNDYVESFSELKNLRS